MTARAFAVAAAALAVTAAPAHAATLDAINACYVSTGETTTEREDVTVKGKDFAPLSTVDVYLDGVLYGNAPTDAVGAFERYVDAPHQAAGERAFTITVTDGVNTLTVQSRVTNLAVTVRPRSSPPSRRVHFRGRGFLQDAPVYAHYLYRGRERKTVRLARRPATPCGTFSVKRRQIPVEKARTGRWLVQIDQKKAYSQEPDPVWVRLPIDVEEVFLRP